MGERAEIVHPGSRHGAPVQKHVGETRARRRHHAEDGVIHREVTSKGVAGCSEIEVHQILALRQAAKGACKHSAVIAEKVRKSEPEEAQPLAVSRHMNKCLALDRE
jgi:hypothetical protein